MQADVQAGEWVSLAEAATRLGCSVDTLRRRLKRRELPGRQVGRPQGFTWEVFVGDCLPPDGHVRSTLPTSSALDLSALVGLLERTQAQLLEQTALAAAFQQRCQLLEARVAELAQARALPAGEESKASTDAIDRPWWAFWRWEQRGR
jgi:excisionase family DNA binding protein